jgi:hypothetical protein
MGKIKPGHYLEHEDVATSALRDRTRRRSITLGKKGGRKPGEPEQNAAWDKADK